MEAGGAEQNMGETTRQTILLPEPTAWPVLFAMGLTLTVAALVTNYGLGILGIVLTVMAIIGWFRDVLPRERHETIEVMAEIVPVSAALVKVTRIEVNETHRAQLPLQMFSVSSGIKGGIAGGIAMIIPAELYGVFHFHSVWYVINLLGGAGVGGWTSPTTAEIAQFNPSALLTATVIHVSTSLLVGLFYGAMLPLWPKRPILLGGLIAPVLWTGLLYSVLGIVNPFLEQRIDWWSFAASQLVFGLIAGYTVVKLGHIKQLAQMPLAVRLGVETPGIHSSARGKEPKR